MRCNVKRETKASWIWPKWFQRTRRVLNTPSWLKRQNRKIDWRWISSLKSSSQQRSKSHWYFSRNTFLFNEWDQKQHVSLMSDDSGALITDQRWDWATWKQAWKGVSANWDLLKAKEHTEYWQWFKIYQQLYRSTFQENRRPWERVHWKPMPAINLKSSWNPYAFAKRLLWDRRRNKSVSTICLDCRHILRHRKISKKTLRTRKRAERKRFYLLKRRSDFLRRDLG